MVFDWLPLIRGESPQVREIRVEKPVVTAALPGVAPVRPEHAAKDQVQPSPQTSLAAPKRSTGAAWRFPIRFQVSEGQLILHDETFGGTNCGIRHERHLEGGRTSS